jgi:hypothetical protein
MLAVFGISTNCLCVQDMDFTVFDQQFTGCLL